MNKKYHFCILANEIADDHNLWVKACQSFSEQVSFDVIDLTAHNWLDKITSNKYDYFLAKPPGLSAKFKQLFDERIFIIVNVLGYPVYPSLTEIYIYENKRFLASWLQANKLPHPKTRCFYNLNETLAFLKSGDLPIVAKSNIGASGSGVKILDNLKNAEEYAFLSFSDKGAPRRWGPNISKGRLVQRGLHYLKNPDDISKKLQKYKTVKEDVQSGLVIFQEYIKHDFEWRVVAIASSYFAHKKLKMGDKASGSTLKQYDNPPLKLFDFARKIMNRFKLTSQALDIFETADGKFLINEMQCIFGQSDPYQMLVDGIPGRYQYIDNNWVFEEGNFNGNECYDLRVESILRNLSKFIMKRYKVIIRGLLGFIPGLLEILKDRKEHTGTIDARYCYSVWFRHLILLNKVGCPFPYSLAELGPGASLGVGIAALISGVDRYYAFDILKHSDVNKNIEVFYELLDLFKNREPIPSEKEFKSLKPLLQNYDFPSHILNDDWLEKALDKKRIADIEKSIVSLEQEKDGSMIKYMVPWNDVTIIQKESIDLIISQAVMEHVLELEKTYEAMHLWLNKKGFISHQIDFKAHETSDKWYGHRVYSDLVWKIIMKGRSYGINRAPYIAHKKHIKKHFNILFEETIVENIPWDNTKFNSRFKNYTQEDLAIANAFIIASKKIKKDN